MTKSAFNMNEGTLPENICLLNLLRSREDDRVCVLAGLGGGGGGGSFFPPGNGALGIMGKLVGPYILQNVTPLALYCVGHALVYITPCST